MEHFVLIVNSWKSLTIITIIFILDVAAALDPPLRLSYFQGDSLIVRKGFPAPPFKALTP